MSRTTNATERMINVSERASAPWGKATDAQRMALLDWSGVIEIAADALVRYVATGHIGPWDAGPPILASLLAETGAVAQGQVEAVVETWLDAYPAQGLGLHGGAAGLCFGLWVAAQYSKRFEPSHARIRASLCERAASMRWRNPVRDWEDYDLVTGASGVLSSLTLVLGASRNSAPVAAHLVRLLTSPDMRSFRVVDCRDDPLRGWNFNTINLGLAHGIVGPIAALTAYLRNNEADGLAAEAVQLATAWLMAETREDSRGILTWPPGRIEKKTTMPTNRRQAWCYGAPGNAFVLWDAGNLLCDTGTQSFAVDVFRRYAMAFDPVFHLDDHPLERLAICHGAAGIMLIADAFARNVGIKQGQDLADAMEAYLLSMWPSLPSQAALNPTLQGGGLGVLVALLARRQEKWSWMRPFGLR